MKRRLSPSVLALAERASGSSSVGRGSDVGACDGPGTIVAVSRISARPFPYAPGKARKTCSVAGSSRDTVAKPPPQTVALTPSGRVLPVNTLCMRCELVFQDAMDKATLDEVPFV